MAKTVLVTGASSGIGEATAIYLAQAGYTVYGAARRTDKLQALAVYGIRPVTLDVTDDGSMTGCIATIAREAGPVDVLVNSAGLGSYGALEDVPMDEAKNQIDINLFGTARLIQLVLPAMRKNNWGKIVNISSVGGKVGLSDSLRNEVRPFGIDVIVIEPGGTKSEMISIGGNDLQRVSGKTVYKPQADRLVKMYDDIEKNAVEPVEMAKLIKKSIEARRPRARYVGGSMAGMMLFFRKILSDKLFDRLIMSQMG